ncbi:MAG: hypothetical protein WCB11_07915 [Terriglobales bacterium]
MPSVLGAAEFEDRPAAASMAIGTGAAFGRAIEIVRFVDDEIIRSDPVRSSLVFNK